jgi:hypothetical protein
LNLDGTAIEPRSNRYASTAGIGESGFTTARLHEDIAVMSRVRIASMTWLSSLGIIVAPRPTRSLEARTQFRRHSRCRSKQNKRSARLTGKLAVKRWARNFGGA